MNENNGTPGFAPRRQTQRTMGVVRAPSAVFTVLDNHHPPLNVRVVSEALSLFLDGQGLAHLMLEDANVVAVGAIAGHDAVHADFRGVAAVTIGEVFEGDDDPEISFGTAAKALSKDKSLATPLALFYQLKPRPSLPETLAYSSEITSRNGARSPAILTFPAVVEAPPAQSTLWQPSRGQRGAPGVVRVCYAKQRGKGNVSAEMYALSATTPQTWRTPLLPHLCVTPRLNVVCVQLVSLPSTVWRNDLGLPQPSFGGKRHPRPAMLASLLPWILSLPYRRKRWTSSAATWQAPLLAQVPSVCGSMAVLGFDIYARDR
jgi:hypothetical protein